MRGAPSKQDSAYFGECASRSFNTSSAFGKRRKTGEIGKKINVDGRLILFGQAVHAGQTAPAWPARRVA
jgi:hypothetical protein